MKRKPALSKEELERRTRNREAYARALKEAGPAELKQARDSLKIAGMPEPPRGRPEAS